MNAKQAEVCWGQGFGARAPDLLFPASVPLKDDLSTVLSRTQSPCSPAILPTSAVGTEGLAGMTGVTGRTGSVWNPGRRVSLMLYYPRVIMLSY